MGTRTIGACLKCNRTGRLNDAGQCDRCNPSEPPGRASAGCALVVLIVIVAALAYGYAEWKREWYKQLIRETLQEVESERGQK